MGFLFLDVSRCMYVGTRDELLQCGDELLQCCATPGPCQACMNPGTQMVSHTFNVNTHTGKTGH